MKPLKQSDTPVADALEEQRVNRLAHFDVPGHKGGRMNPALNDYFGAKLMTLECGMRFLADYLNGDKYFRIHRPGHNLDRAHTQFALVRSMEENWDAMQEIVRKI